MARAKPKQPLPDRLARATLHMAAQGWTHVTAARLAKAAACTAGEAADFLSNPCQAMRALADYITHQTLKNHTPDSRSSPRDALFELLMLRFDILQSYRGGILAIAEASKHDATLAVALAAAQPPQWQAMLRAADIQRATPLHVAGLGAIYAYALRVWRHDTSSDLSKTMAALDKQLRRVERLWHLLLHGNAD